MAILLSCQSIGKTFSSRPLFQGISLGIEEGERVGLIGPNGAGKTTLLNIFAGNIEPDQGKVVWRKQLRMAFVPQQPSLPLDATVFDCISAAAQEAEFEAHERAASIDSTLDALGFSDRQALVGSLSGGWRKRVAIGCAVVKQPELLFMDEPTNHLDFEGILWLEKYLKSSRFSYVLVSHDRAFLENAANRVVEINPAYPQGFISVQGAYSDFLISREQVLSAQLHLEQALASKVRREIAWLQRGARARQTKSRSRIDEAGRLVEELAEVKGRNVLNRQAEIEFDASGRKTKELITLKNVHKSMGKQKLVSDLSLVITSRTRLGLVGRNGSGKTTLLRLLIGHLQPDAGEVKKAPDLKVVWFDQNREQLDQSLSLKDCLCRGSDSVVYRGQSLHVMTWAKKFLFKPDQLNMPISYLSGGEQSRILIANLMLQTADILILDEPTNDLDIPTLEVLEESLEDFPGAIALVTHDRMMLHSVTNTVLALDGTGGAESFADFEQCEQSLDRFLPLTKKKEVEGKEKKTRIRVAVGLSTAEKRELAGLPDKIEKAEAAMRQLHKEMESPQTAANFAKLQLLVAEQEKNQRTLDQLYARWQELEEKDASAT